MGSFVSSNVSICGISNFSRQGKCSTPVVNGDSVYCTRASIETRARPLYCFLHVAELLLDVPEPVLPQPLLCLLLTKDELIAFVVPTLPLLIAILSGGLVRVMLPGVTSFSFSICFSTRVEVLFFSGNRVLAFSGLSCLLGALYLPDELLQLSQQALVGETERLYLVRVDMYSF